MSRVLSLGPATYTMRVPSGEISRLRKKPCRWNCCVDGGTTARRAGCGALRDDDCQTTTVAVIAPTNARAHGQRCFRVAAGCKTGAVVTDEARAAPAPVLSRRN